MTKQKHQTDKDTKKKARKTKVLQSKIPSLSLEEALRVSQTINDNFAKDPTKPLNVAMALDLTPGSGHFRNLLGASSAYGLTEGSYNSETISLTDLSIKIVSPTEEGMKESALKEAFLQPTIIKGFLEKYSNSKVPTDKIAFNVLGEIGLPMDSAKSAFDIIIEGGKKLGLIQDIKGSLYVDLDGIPSEEISNVDDEITDEIKKESKTSETTENNSDTDVQPQNDIGKVSGAENQKVSNNRVFITHGRNKEIVTQLKEILTFGKFVPVVAAENETVSKPVPDKVLDDMKSCSAAIIHVGKEIKLLDQGGKEHIFINQNVLIEIGAAMALYNRQFILLVEDGTNLPSNLQGLYEVRYSGDKLDYEATMKLLKAFNDFQLK